MIGEGAELLEAGVKGFRGSDKFPEILCQYCETQIRRATGLRYISLVAKYNEIRSKPQE